MDHLSSTEVQGEEPREPESRVFFWTGSRAGEKNILRCLNKEEIFVMRSQVHPRGRIQPSAVEGRARGREALQAGCLHLSMPSLLPFTSRFLECSQFV